MAATENQDFFLEAATNLLTKTVHEWSEIQDGHHQRTKF